MESGEDCTAPIDLAPPDDPFTLPLAPAVAAAPSATSLPGTASPRSGAGAGPAAPTPVGLPADPFALPQDPFSTEVGSSAWKVDRGDGEEKAAAFPRIPDTPAVSSGEEVGLEIHQRRAKDRHSSFEVHATPDGEMAIPLSVNTTKVRAKLPRVAALRSPFLARCLVSPVGTSVYGEFAPRHEADGADLLNDAAPAGDGDARPSERGVTSNRLDGDNMEIILPSRGIGQRLLTPGGLTQCMDLCGCSAQGMDAEIGSTPIIHVLTFFLWAAVLELPSVMEGCRAVLLSALDVETVVPILAVGHVTGDFAIISACYWILRDAICRVSGAPPDWVAGKGPVRLGQDYIAHAAAGRVPLRALSGVVDASLQEKRKRWQVPFEGYTLCQLHRQRGQDGAYPHRYELRLDHNNELVLSAIREDEQGSCRIFEGGAASEESSEHSAEYLGSVVSNFWGTQFTVFDCGVDADSIYRHNPAAKGFPLHQKVEVNKIGFEANIIGDCPRKVKVDFDHGGSHYHMENIEPRWDKKLGSYSLPFFGRVKKASAKNFQLVVDKDPNTIYLMFGKISKDVYCLDYRAPIPHLDAMAIALAALAKKRAVS